MSTDRRPSRSELKRAYKETPPPMGVFAIRNQANGKVALGIALNAQGMLNRLRFELTQNMHSKYPGLQEDWNRYGPERFTFEVLDTLKPQDEPRDNPMEELKVLEALWLERLKPYGDAGYNVAP
jgi:hypothetical protein